MHDSAIVPHSPAAGLPKEPAPLTLALGVGTTAREIAVRTTPGGGPAIVWLGGFRSDMLATKATRLAGWGAEMGRKIVRFDYSGHGESSGRFEDGTIGTWLHDSLAVIDTYGGVAPVLVGSSMGGWLALLAARRMSAQGRPPSGLVLIAPAPDFTEELMWDRLSQPARDSILSTGMWMQPSAYSPDPYPITRALIEEGRNHLLLGGTFKVGCPVHVLQGMQDEDVPWRHAQKLVERLAEDDVVLTLVKDGDHRLSRPEDIDRMFSAIEAIAPPHASGHTAQP